VFVCVLVLGFGFGDVCLVYVLIFLLSDRE